MKRPKIITIICVLGFISVVFSFPQVFSPGIKKIGIAVPGIYGLLIALQFITYVGLWHFKQWGGVGFIAVFFCKLYFNILINDLGVLYYTYMVYAILSSVFIFRYFRQMNTGF